MNEFDFRVTRKLKRGLQDLSPLFQLPSSPTPEAVSFLRVFFDVQFLTVCVPDHEGDAFLANAFLASQVVRQTNLFASLVSIAPGFSSFPSQSADSFPALELLDSRISRIRLSHQELWRRFPVASPPSHDFPPFLVFLEFEPAQFRSLARVALLLDRVILFVQPQVESLKEAYRLIKMFWSLNREIEFLLLFRGPTPQEHQEEFLFERFSLITSRFLGISTEWLGNLSFPDKNNQPVISSERGSGFNPDPLLAAEGLRRPLAPEKIRFWRELQKILQNRLRAEPGFSRVG